MKITAKTTKEEALESIIRKFEVDIYNQMMMFVEEIDYKELVVGKYKLHMVYDLQEGHVLNISIMED